MNVGILSIALLTLSLNGWCCFAFADFFPFMEGYDCLGKATGNYHIQFDNTNGKRYGYCICNSILGSLDKSINSSSVTYDTAVIDANKNKTPSLKSYKIFFSIIAYTTITART